MTEKLKYEEIRMRRAPNGGWIVLQSIGYADMDKVIGAYSNTEEMLSALRILVAEGRGND